MLRTDRRLFVGGCLGLLVGPGKISRANDVPTIHVFKTATCSCCKMWVDHLSANGISVEAEVVTEIDAVKRMAVVPDHLASCHTGIVEGYTIEGHVPAAAIVKLLRERPAIKGLTVPGMPAGSPGMPSPEPERYDVIAFGQDKNRVFMSFVETDPV